MWAKLFFGHLIVMTVLPSADKHESKSAVPAVPASQITHFEDPELRSLLGRVRKHQCWRADATTASKSHLSNTALLQTELKCSMPCCINLFFTSTVCRLSAFSVEKKDKIPFMPGFKSHDVNQIIVHASLHPKENSTCMRLDKGVGFFLVFITLFETSNEAPISGRRKWASCTDFLCKLNMCLFENIDFHVTNIVQLSWDVFFVWPMVALKVTKNNILENRVSENKQYFPKPNDML